MATQSLHEPCAISINLSILLYIHNTSFKATLWHWSYIMALLSAFSLYRCQLLSVLMEIFGSWNCHTLPYWFCVVHVKWYGSTQIIQYKMPFMWMIRFGISNPSKEIKYVTIYRLDPRPQNSSIAHLQKADQNIKKANVGDRENQRDVTVYDRTGRVFNCESWQRSRWCRRQIDTEDPDSHQRGRIALGTRWWGIGKYLPSILLCVAFKS